MKREDHKEIEFVRELMKDKPDEEICEAEENFRRYLALVKRICERLEREEEEKQKSEQLPLQEINDPV